MSNPESHSTESPATAPWSGGLSDLHAVPFDEKHEAMFAQATAHCGGSAFWSQRKRSEFREILALEQVSDRLTLLTADLSVDLRFKFVLRGPVPTMPVPDGDLVIVDHVVVALIYPEVAVRMPQPGYAFVHLEFPNHIWHPNVQESDYGTGAVGPGQALCLGAELPAGVAVKELVLQTFSALSLQSVQLDHRDPAGIMNFNAAQWYLQNRERIPLTREGFLAPTQPIEPAPQS